jgi:hypothetical protein
MGKSQHGHKIRYLKIDVERKARANFRQHDDDECNNLHIVNGRCAARKFALICTAHASSEKVMQIIKEHYYNY